MVSWGQSCHGTELTFPGMEPLVLVCTNHPITHSLVKQVAGGSMQARVLNTSPPLPIRYYSQVLLLSTILRRGDADDLRKFLFCESILHGRWPARPCLGLREATGARCLWELHLRQRQCPLPCPAVSRHLSVSVLCYTFILAFVNSLLLDYGFHKGTTFCHILFT